MQDCSIYTANALEILRSCTKPSICPCNCKETNSAFDKPYILYTGNAFPCLNPSWTQIRIFRNNQVNTLVANALATKLRQDISIEYAKYNGPFRSSRIISATWVFSLVHIDTIKPIRMFHLHFSLPFFHTYQHNADNTNEDMICFPNYLGNGNENKWPNVCMIKISRLRI